MRKSKLSRFKEGFLYALIFIGFNIIKNVIFDYAETSQLFSELSQASVWMVGVFVVVILVVWLIIGFLIGSGLIISDALKKVKENS